MFQKLVSFTKKVADLPDKPSLSSSELKAQFDAAPDEVRQSFNNLIDALKSTLEGDSGAKNIGLTAITDLTGSDVQSVIEDLKSKTYAPTDIKTPTLLNGWTDNSTQWPSKYWKEANGMVHYNLAVGGGNMNLNNAIMIFPAGYRPGTSELKSGHVDNGGTNEDVIYSISATTGNLQSVRNLPANGLVILSGSFKAVN